MPIYEFYCPGCHTVFSFLSRKVNTRKRPACPRCERPRLERKVSPFAISRRRAEPGDEDLPDIDEARLEQAMEELSRETGSADEDDPRQMARLMRRLYESAGLPLDGNLDEAIRRLEDGEDPDKIEEEMGDVLEEADPFEGGGGKRLSRLRKRLEPPSVDETLYEL
jgi:putative FmdB family regulatory protein